MPFPRRLLPVFLLLSSWLVVVPTSAQAHAVRDGFSQAVSGGLITPQEFDQALRDYRGARSPSAPASLRAAGEVVRKAAREQLLADQAVQAVWGLSASAGRREVVQGRQVVPGTRVEVRLTGGAWWPHQLGTWSWLGAMAKTRMRPAKLAEWLSYDQRLLTRSSGQLLAPTLVPYRTVHGGWTSAMTQATAARALARLSGRLEDPELLSDALGMLTSLTEGQLLIDGRPLLYSDDPQLLVANAHAQTLLAVAEIADSLPELAGLRDRLDATLRADLGSYLSWGWSRYSNQGRYADVGYHQLMGELLAGLCERGMAADYCAGAMKLTKQAAAAPRVAIVRAGQPRGGSRSVVLRVSQPGSLTLTVAERGQNYTAFSGAVIPGRLRLVIRAGRRARTVNATLHSITGRQGVAVLPLASR